ncbi:MAG: polyhydroxyalkanoate synthesis repressor PhaR [Exilibacterium sp.]
MLIIKKYPNRRLYDTSRSQYINLEDIKRLVIEHTEFQIVDSKSGEDLTKNILLQIISDQENNDNQALLTNTVLKQLIRFYDSDMQLFLRQYLEQSLAVFLDRQETLQGVMKDWVDATPMGVFNQLMEQNLGLWSKFTGQGPEKSENNEKE